MNRFPSSPEEFCPAALVSDAELQRWLGGCGRGVKVFRGARLIPPERIVVGDFSQIDEGVRIFAGKGVTLGRHVHLAFYSSISGGGRCVIGDFAGIGAGTRVITGTDLPQEGLTNPTVPLELRSVHRGVVRLGSHVLLYTNVVVLPDIEIGEGAVVAAGSIVHKNLKSWTIYAGNPLVAIGARDPEPIRNAESRAG